jgi:hypothetical protein
MNSYDRYSIEPFHVPAKVLKPTVEAPDKGQPVGPAAKTAPHTASNGANDTDSLAIQVGAGAVFAGVFVLVERNPMFSPLTIVVLLTCTLFRLSARHRRIAAAPVIFAAMLLACQIADACARMALAPTGSIYQQPATMMPNMVAPWLPLFFAVCLFYMPRYETITGKILLIISLLLLVSGLLPGNGFEVIFVTIQYFLFIAIVVGLGIDFTRNATQVPAPAAPAPVTH